MNSKDPETDPIRAVTCDRLRWLSIGNYICGTVTILTVSIFIVHFVMLLVVSFMPGSEWDVSSPSEAEESIEMAGEAESTEAPFEVPDDATGEDQESESVPYDGAPVAFMFRLFAGLVGFFILCGWTVGGLTIYAGRCIAKRKKRTLVFCMAGLNCLSIPYGTLLGIATIMTLSTPDAKDEWGIVRRDDGDIG